MPGAATATGRDEEHEVELERHHVTDLVAAVAVLGAGALEPAGEGQGVAALRPAARAQAAGDREQRAAVLDGGAGRRGSRDGQTNVGVPCGSVQAEVLVVARRACSSPSITMLTVRGQARMLRASAATRRGSSASLAGSARSWSSILLGRD